MSSLRSVFPLGGFGSLVFAFALISSLSACEWLDSEEDSDPEPEPVPFSPNGEWDAYMHDGLSMDTKVSYRNQESDDSVEPTRGGVPAEFVLQYDDEYDPDIPLVEDMPIEYDEQSDQLNAIAAELERTQIEFDHSDFETRFDANYPQQFHFEAEADSYFLTESCQATDACEFSDACQVDETSFMVFGFNDAGDDGKVMNQTIRDIRQNPNAQSETTCREDLETIHQNIINGWTSEQVFIIPVLAGAVDHTNFSNVNRVEQRTFLDLRRSRKDIAQHQAALNLNSELQSESRSPVFDLFFWTEELNWIALEFAAELFYEKEIDRKIPR